MSRSMLVAALGVMLTCLLGSDAHGSTALRANGRIAFAAVGGIASMNPDGSGQWGVELNVGDSSPAWSPDGSQLAVTTKWRGNSGIVVMDPDGTDAHNITNDYADSFPAWSPDGARIAYANGSRILAVKADGSDLKTLASGDYWWVGRPTWAPDGSKLVFSAAPTANNGTHLYVLDLGSSKVTQLTPDGGYDDDAAWSPDGNQIAFVSSRNGNEQIYLMNPDGTNVKQITNDSGYDADPAWSPDQSQIAYSHNGQVWVTARDGSGRHQLTSGDWNGSPAWQPLDPAPAGCTLWGTNANDLLVGTDGNDVICGLDGNDTLIGLGSDDRLFGGAGNDWLAGGLGSNFLSGGPDDDTIDARNGSFDLVAGGAGIDTAVVDGPIDTMFQIERPKVDPNLAAWRPAYADAAEPTNPAERAVDGRIDDWWNSGGYPTHWIEVDLQRPVTIARISLVPTEYPTGAVFMVLGRDDPSQPFRLLHTFDGPTADMQKLGFAPTNPWRKVRYLRIVVPQANTQMGWIAWREISVFGPKPAPAHPRKRR
jgi:WD40-like Beta Propeller Repeat/RTX calcium-binding nonapeptide repeat (4 copies)/F5/8 type C domain